MTQDDYVVMKRSSKEKLIKELKKVKKENQQLKEKLNCKEYFSSTMPEDTEFVILTKNDYDRQQKDLALENIQLKKQKDDVVEYIKKYLQEHIIDDLPDEESKFETENGIPIPNAKEILLRMLGEIDD